MLNYIVNYIMSFAKLANKIKKYFKKNKKDDIKKPLNILSQEERDKKLLEALSNAGIC